MRFSVLTMSNHDVDYQGVAGYQAPAPFKSPQWAGDPLFNQCGSNTTSCNVAWSIIIQHSRHIFIDGAAMYSWFQGYDQTCVNTVNCQQRLVNIYDVGSLYFNDIVTIGSNETVTPAISNTINEIIYAKDVIQATDYPWWTTVATYLDSSSDFDPNIVEAYPVKNGWVSFGDSYAAGIGALLPLDSDTHICKRGTGSYTAILNSILRYGHQVSPTWEWQPSACSGETGEQFLDAQGSDQLGQWDPSSSDIATVSFTGNDVGFGKIVSHCIMGYPYGSRSQCQPDIQAAQSMITSGQVRSLVQRISRAITTKMFIKNPKKRLMIYWTGYPQFFAIEDHVCDASYFQEFIWAGNYLTLSLRQQLNSLSEQMNNEIRAGIAQYNSVLPYPTVVGIYPDSLGIYDTHRFCEPGVQETLKSEVDQATVAFFYDNGWDDIPSAEEGFINPPQKAGAPHDWSVEIDISDTCDATNPNSLVDPLDDMLCAVAQAIAQGNSTVQDFESSGGAGEDIALVNADGSVTVQDFNTRFAKMFHPKTRANWHIAQAVHEGLRYN